MRALRAEDFPAVHRAFTLAFGDYEVPLEMPPAALQEMLQRRGYQPALSRAEFDQNELVAFVLNGTGSWKGRQTIYDTGTGVVPSHRGRGLSRALLRECIDVARAASHEQYLLEVLQSNRVALDIYSSEGFVVERELACFAIMEAAEKPVDGIEIRREGQLPRAEAVAMWNAEPSWQNSLESVMRSGAPKSMWAALDGDTLAGYAVFFPATADLAQLAVQPEYRRRGIGTSLLAAAVREAAGAPVRIVNIDTGDSTTMTFLETRGREFVRQYEMLRQL